MVSLDDAVVGRLERSGKRYEILLDPDLIQKWKQNSDSVDINDLLAVEDVFHDAKMGERPTADSLKNAFETEDLISIVKIILSKGTIQLTTSQRKEIVERKRTLIIQHISSNAIDPKTKLPHPFARIENALTESRYSIDPFKSIDLQIKDAIKLLKPLIPLSFTTVKLAFKVKGSAYGSVSQLLREYMQKEEWMSNGDWVCVVEIPAGMKSDLMSKVAQRDSSLDVRELK